MAKIGDVLTFAGVPKRITKPAQERFIRLRLNGGGATERPIAAGKTPKPFTGYRVARGQLIFSRIDARNGAFGLVPDELDGAVVSKDFPVFTVAEDQISPDYLLRYINSGLLRDQIRAFSFGATNRQRVSESAFLNFDLPLPPMNEQLRITRILNEADIVRSSRMRIRSGLEELEGSLFHAQFGNPLTGRHYFPKARIGSLATVITGNSPSRDDPGLFGDAIEWLKSSNLGTPIASQAREGLSKAGMLSARVAPAGSVLVTCIAGSSMTIGKSAMIDRAAAFNQQINAVLPSAKLNNDFLLSQLRTFPDLVRLKSTGGMKGLVSKSAFQAIEILAPPIKVQRKFASQLMVVREQNSLIERAMVTDEELFASLEHRAFRGEL